MAQIKNVLNVLNILPDQNEYLDMNNDILCIPVHDKNPDFKQILIDNGFFWDEESESWATF